MAKPDPKRNPFMSSDFVALEKDRWARFNFETKADRSAMVAMIKARTMHDTDSRAAQRYDQLLLELMNLYLTPKALQRYQQGFSDAELDAVNDRSLLAWGVVSAELGMLSALNSIVQAHPLERGQALMTFVENLYWRWQWIEHAGEAAVAAVSADGANL